METTLQITSVSVTPENLINGETTSYRFRIVSSSPLQNLDKIIIEFPPSVQLPMVLECEGIILLDLKLDCF